MAYAHPLFGFLVVAAVLWVGSRGLRARQRRPGAAEARAVHARFAPLVLVLCLGAATFGTLSAAWFRPDLSPAGSWHFRVGWCVAGLLVAGWALSRRFPVAPSARRAHALVGLAAMLGALVGLLLGLGILPD